MPNARIYSPVPSEWLHDPNEQHIPSTVHFSAGKIVGLLDNGKLLGFAEALERMFYASGAKEVVRWTKSYAVEPLTKSLIDEICNSVDYAVVGLGN